MVAALRVCLTDEDLVYIQEIVHVRDDTTDVAKQWNKLCSDQLAPVVTASSSISIVHVAQVTWSSFVIGSGLTTSLLFENGPAGLFKCKISCGCLYLVSTPSCRGYIITGTEFVHTNAMCMTSCSLQIVCGCRLPLMLLVESTSLPQFTWVSYPGNWLWHVQASQWQALPGSIQCSCCRIILYWISALVVLRDLIT